MKFLVLTFVCLFVSILSHTFLWLVFGTITELFSPVWWVITVVSGIIGWFASEELI